MVKTYRKMRFEIYLVTSSCIYTSIFYSSYVFNGSTLKRFYVQIDKEAKIDIQRTDLRTYTPNI